MGYPQFGDILSSYPLHLREYLCGLRERARAVGNCGRWPKSNVVWAEGVVGAVTADDGAGTLTFEDATDPPNTFPMPSGSSGASRFVGYEHPVDCFTPADYDVVIEAGGADDETRIVRGRVTANTVGPTATITFEGAEVDNAIVGGYLANRATLTGKRYHVIKHGGQWWGGYRDAVTRWPEFPNDRELWRDVATVGSDKFLRAPFNRLAGTAVPQGWAPDEWAGEEVLVYRTGGRLVRLAVVWNTADTLYFIPKPDPLAEPPEPDLPPDWVDPAPAYATSGLFLIVPPGTRAMPDRWGMKPFWSNGGAKRSVLTLSPSDVGGLGVGSIDLPATSVEWAEGSPCNPTTPTPCEAVLYFTTDPDLDPAERDLWSFEFEECGAPEASDRNYSPDYFKSPRGWQQEAVRLAAKYLDPLDLAAGAMPNMTPARFFRFIGVNWGTSAVTEPSADVFEAAVDPIYNGYHVHWTVRNADGSNRLSGTSVAAAGKIGLSSELWNATEAAVDPANRTNDVGKTVIYSAGFTRVHPREVRRAYPKGPIFIPDVVTSDLGVRTVIATPHVINLVESGCLGVGRLVRWDRSTAYLVTDAFEAGADSDEPLALNEAVRWMGDNSDDPSIRTLPGGGGIIEPGTEDAEVAGYWKRFAQAVHPPVAQGRITAQRRGVATAGNYFSLTDADRDFLETWWGNGGAVRTETGTATGGTISTLIDAGKIPAEGNEAGCYWEAGRWVPEGKPFKGLVLRMTSGANAGEKRLIVNGDPATGTLTVSPAFASAVAAGDDYEIDEFAEANTFEGRTLRVWHLDDPAAFTDLIILGNDHTTLFFSPEAEFDAAEGQEWEIIDHEPGGVWLVAAAKPADPLTPYIRLAADRWLVKPSGPDPRGIPDWHDDQRENLPFLAPKRFGYFRKGDYPTRDFWRELWRGVNAMRKFFRPAAWSAWDGVTVDGLGNPVPDTNVRSASSGESGANCPTLDSASEADVWACVKGLTEDTWDGTFDPEGPGRQAGTENVPPRAAAQGQLSPPDGGGSGFLERLYSYAFVDDLPTCFDLTVEIYVRAVAYAPAEFFPPPLYDSAFDTLGDGVGAEGQWWAITAASLGDTGETRRYRVGYTGAADAWGPSNKPNWGPAPTGDTIVIRGYQVEDGGAVVTPVFACCAGEIPPDAPSEDMTFEELWEWFEGA